MRFGKFSPVRSVASETKATSKLSNAFDESPPYERRSAGPNADTPTMAQMKVITSPSSKRSPSEGSVSRIESTELYDALSAKGR